MESEDFKSPGEHLCDVIKNDPTELIPGSWTYRMIKEDKSENNRLGNLAGYVACPLRDTMLLGIYAMVCGGLVRIIGEVTNNVPIQEFFTKYVP